MEQFYLTRKNTKLSYFFFFFFFKFVLYDFGFMKY